VQISGGIAPPRIHGWRINQGSGGRYTTVNPCGKFREEYRPHDPKQELLPAVAATEGEGAVAVNNGNDIG